MENLQNRIEQLSPEQRARLEKAILDLANREKSDSPQLPPLRLIPRIEELRLSLGQERLWFLDRLEPNSVVYNIPIGINISGSLDIGLLERSIYSVIRRHEILRTGFIEKNGIPLQSIFPEISFQVIQLDLSSFDEKEIKARIDNQIQIEIGTPFDLSTPPLFRIQVMHIDREHHVLLLTMHHIISDGWSLGVLLKEIALEYGSQLSGQQNALGNLSFQFADYANWQRDLLQTETLNVQLDFWREKLKDSSFLLDLPADKSRPVLQTFKGRSFYFRLGREMTSALLSLGRENDCTLFMTLLSIFQVLIHRYTGQLDIVIGTPIANRRRIELEALIGFFVNALPLRTRITDNPTFREYLSGIRTICLEAYAHPDVPFEKLVEELRPQRDLSRSPIFQVMFALQNAPLPELKMGEIEITPLQIDSKTSKFDLTLFVENRDEDLFCCFEYNTLIFEESRIARMADHLKSLITGIIADPNFPILDYRILSESEWEMVTVGWNRDKVNYPAQQCIHELFEIKAGENPQEIAVVTDHDLITYQDLNFRANQLAAYLRTIQIGPESLIGICIDRSVDMIIAMMGILKAGGAYLPLDPTYPKDRIDYILADSCAKVILTEQKNKRLISSDTAIVIALDLPENTMASHSGENLPKNVSLENLAYMLYTSGSTGKPKGVALLHEGASNLIQWAKREFGRSMQRTLASTSISFDLSVFEIFGTLASGGTVVLVQNALDLIRRPQEKLTLINTVPSAASMLLEAEKLPENISLNLAGEPIPKILVKRLGNRRKIRNLYGPTETTTYSTCAHLDPENPMITIGRPIDNTQIYILDRSMEPVPIGIPGEIYIGGMGLARGYWRRPELTAEKFVPNPFSTIATERLYRTGDLGRYLENGEIEFLGRADFQVKLRGFRIELGEIESVLREYSGIKDAVVEVRESSSSEQSLVAFIVLDGSLSESQDNIRNYLKEKLPEFMVPTSFVFLTSMPLNQNGKIERKLLPAFDWGRSRTAKISPKNATEKVLAEIWMELLGIESVGTNENFFQLGGHSLLAVRVSSRIRTKIGKDLPLKILFQNPTIAELADACTRAQAESYFPPLKRIAPSENPSMSFGQERLWFLEQLQPGLPRTRIARIARAVLDIGERSLVAG